MTPFQNSKNLFNSTCNSNVGRFNAIIEASMIFLMWLLDNKISQENEQPGCFLRWLAGSDSFLGSSCLSHLIPNFSWSHQYMFHSKHMYLHKLHTTGADFFLSLSSCFTFLWPTLYVYHISSSNLLKIALKKLYFWGNMVLPLELISSGFQINWEVIENHLFH